MGPRALLDVGRDERDAERAAELAHHVGEAGALRDVLAAQAAESASVVSGTKRRPGRRRGRISGQKKSCRSDASVELRQQQREGEEETEPEPRSSAAAARLFCSGLPTNGIMTAVASAPGSRISPVCMAVKPSRFCANTGKMKTERVEPEAEDEGEERADGERAVLQHPQVDDRMLRRRARAR